MVSFVCLFLDMSSDVQGIVSTVVIHLVVLYIYARIEWVSKCLFVYIMQSKATSSGSAAASKAPVNAVRNKINLFPLSPPPSLSLGFPHTLSDHR